MRSSEVLTAHVTDEIDRWRARFPEDRAQSAVIAALHAAQHENQGYLTTEIMDAVADYLGLPCIHVYEVATFYSMFETNKVGRHNVSICTNISCMLRGADELVEHVEQKCLAACCGAPMMMVNHRYYEHLTKDMVDEILEGLE